MRPRPRVPRTVNAGCIGRRVTTGRRDAGRELGIREARCAVLAPAATGDDERGRGGHDPWRSRARPGAQPAYDPKS